MYFNEYVFPVIIPTDIKINKLVKTNGNSLQVRNLFKQLC